MTFGLNPKIVSPDNHDCYGIRTHVKSRYAGCINFWMSKLYVAAHRMYKDECCLDCLLQAKSGTNVTKSIASICSQIFGIQLCIHSAA